MSQKLGVVAGSTVAAIGTPANYQELLRPLPNGVCFCAVNAKPRLIHYFCTQRVRLAKDLPTLRRKMRDDTMLWVSWPKKSAGLPTTVTEDVVRELALPLGLVDTKVCAVDETWSGLKLVIRKELRGDGPGVHGAP